MSSVFPGLHVAREKMPSSALNACSRLATKRSSFAYGRQRYVRIVRTCRRQRQRVGVPVEKRRPRVVGIDVAVERIGNRELAGGNRDPGDILLSAELIGAVVDRLLFASQEVKASPPVAPDRIPTACRDHRHLASSAFTPETHCK
jgi:hypothetical protein